MILMQQDRLGARSSDILLFIFCLFKLYIQLFICLKIRRKATLRQLILIKLLLNANPTE